MGSLIAIGGSKGSGKDTVVNYLEAKLQNRSYSIMKFASPLNRWLYSEYRVHPTMLNVSGIDKDTEMTNVCWTGIPVDIYHKYYHQCFDSVRLTVRECQQYLGNDYAKGKYGDDIWLKKSKADAKHFFDLNPNGTLIFSDLRFDYEFDWINACGGTVIKLDSVPDKDSHVSENSLNKYHYSVPAKGKATEESTCMAVYELTDWARYLKDKKIQKKVKIV